MRGREGERGDSKESLRKPIDECHTSLIGN